MEGHGTRACVPCLFLFENHPCPLSCPSLINSALVLEIKIKVQPPEIIGGFVALNPSYERGGARGGVGGGHEPLSRGSISPFSHQIL